MRRIADGLAAGLRPAGRDVRRQRAMIEGLESRCLLSVVAPDDVTTPDVGPAWAALQVTAAPTAEAAATVTDLRVLGFGVGSEMVTDAWDRNDVILDATRNQLLIVKEGGFAGEGRLLRYDINSRQMLPPLPILFWPPQPGDISADGSTVYLAGPSTVQYWSYSHIYGIDLATGASRDHSFGTNYGSGAGGVVMADGTIVFQNYINVMRLDPRTGNVEYARFNGNQLRIAAGSEVERSADRSAAVFHQGNEVSIFTGDHPLVQLSLGGFDSDHHPWFAVNADASLVAVDTKSTGISIRNRANETVAALTGVHGTMAFDPSHGLFYVAGVDRITAYDTAQWLPRFSFPVGERVSEGSMERHGQIILTTDGQTLFYDSPSGVRRYDLYQPVSQVKHGQGLVLSAEVRGSDPGSAPTGPVHFTDAYSGRLLGEAALISGTASLSLPGLDAGVYSIVASYAGDESGLPSESPATALAVNPLVTTTSLTCSDSLIRYTPFTLTASVSAETGVTVTGKVLFLDGQTTLGEANLANGVAELSVPGIGGGAHEFTAVHVGDGNRLSSSSPVVRETITHSIVVTLLALYTPAARTALGSTGAIELRIRDAVKYTNEAFQNSRIPVILSLTVMRQVSYGESGSLATNLERLTTDGDSFMDEVFALRNQYAADLVSLFVASGDVGGIAWQMRDLDAADNDTRGFSVVQAQQAASPTYTLAHELGHNFGAGHDPEQNDGPGLFPYSYGHRFTGDISTYKDIMSYEPGWTILYFSNPDVRYGGNPTGVAGGADNARTIRYTAPVVARYRNAGTMAASIALVSDEHGVLRATVTDATGQAAVPTGMVAYRKGHETLGFAPLVNGVATWALGPSRDTMAVSAVYMGDAVFASAESAPVIPIPPKPSTIELGISSFIVDAGQPVTLTAQVSAEGAQPRGGVVFMAGAAELGAAPLDDNGRASLTVVLPPGAHMISAVYLGDSQVRGNTAGPLTILVAAPLIDVSISLRASSTRTLADQPVTFTAQLASAAGAPGGRVRFMNGDTVLGEALVDASGVARFTAARLPAGGYWLTAEYAGEGVHAPATSAIWLLEVERGRSPVGKLTVREDRVSGWVYDSDGLQKALTIRINIDGVFRAGFKTKARAKASSNGITRWAIDATLPPLRVGPHRVDVYALDAGTGIPVLLTSKTVQTGQSLFNERYYLARNRDAAAAVAAGQYTSGWMHFVQVGQAERRNPSASFDQRFYLSRYKDAARLVKAGRYRSAFEHYLMVGRRQDRQPRPAKVKV